MPILILPFLMLLSITDKQVVDSVEAIPLRADSVSSQPVAQPEIEVFIESVEVPIGSDSVVVDILCDTKGMAIGGFDLLISTSSDLLAIVAVEPGELQVANHWSMFSSSESVPEKVWHLVSLARSMTNNDSLAVLAWSGESSIARIMVRFGDIKNYWDTTHSIQFLWGKCSDNTFSDSTGSNLMVGKLADTTVQMMHGNSSGGYWGPPEDCFGKSPRPPRETIKFHNGGVIVRSEIDTIPPAPIELIE